MFRGSRVVVLAATVLLWPLGAAKATASPIVVFNNGGPGDPQTSNAIDIQTTGHAMDDFVLASDTQIDGIGFFFQTFDDISNWDYDIDYSILADSVDTPGTPGAPIVGDHVQPVSATDSGLPWCCGGNAYEVSFNLTSPFTASAGVTYWLELGGATGVSDAWWVTADDNTLDNAGTSPAYGDEGSGPSVFPYQLAFYLTEDVAAPVPEPGSITLIGLGLAMGAYRLRRQRRTTSAN